MPNGVAEAKKTYAIKPFPPVVEAMAHLAAAVQPVVTGKVWGLVDDPFPDGHRAYEGYLKDTYSLTIEETTPRYELIYTVDKDEGLVIVISISPKVQ